METQKISPEDVGVLKLNPSTDEQLKALNERLAYVKEKAERTAKEKPDSPKVARHAEKIKAIEAKIATLQKDATVTK